MLDREYKSAILNVGSFAGVLPTQYFSVYSGTKAYINFLSQAVAAEHPRIDIMVLNPNEVSSNMTYNKPPDLMTILPVDCVKAALRDLGKETQSDGRINSLFRLESQTTGLHLQIDPFQTL
jgi:short-subunit dehydrogenase